MINVEVPHLSNKEINIFLNSLKQILMILYGDENEITYSKVQMLVELAKKDYPENNHFWRTTQSYLRFLEKGINSANIDEILGHKFESINALESAFLSYRSKTETKQFAINYTENWILEFFQEFDKAKPIRNAIDPFGGTGRLLNAIVLELNKDTPNLYLLEYYHIAGQIGYLRLLSTFRDLDLEYSKIRIQTGDTFIQFLDGDKQFLQKGKFDLVVMNPPFTRAHHWSEITRNRLGEIFLEYRDLLVGQPGLHIYSIILTDILLENDGQLLAVLPMSTFQSEYSKGIQRLYLANYSLNELVLSTSQISFSVGSDFREILVAFVKKKSDGKNKVKFSLHANSGSKNSRIQRNIVPQHAISKEWNWSIYFKPRSLTELKSKLLEKGLISGEKLGLVIKRGVEMYGPDFFCIPNEIWKIKRETTTEFMLSSNQIDIHVPLSYLIKALRKPAHYKKTITPIVKDYLLSIPENGTNDNIDRYKVQYPNGEPKVAIKKFGEHWIHHIHTQLNVKNPFGHVFFIDKLAITSSGIICHYTEERMTSTKNFYVVFHGDKRLSKLIASWFNSTIFLVLYLINRREIGSSYGRMQIVDIQNSPIFVDFELFDEEIQSEILIEFDRLCLIEMPNHPNQVENRTKYLLDYLILKGLGLEEPEIAVLLNSVYIGLTEYFSEMI